MNESLTQFSYGGDNLPPLPEGIDDRPAAAPMPVMPGTAPQFVNPNAPNPTDGVPMFELVAIRLPDGTWAHVEYVSILTPGDPKAVARLKVSDGIRRRYAYYYGMWKNGMKMAPSGTPLEMWPILTSAQVLELKAANIFTVEQLRDVADVNLNRLPMGVELREKARKWLELKVNADVLAQQQSENQALRDGMKLQADEMAEMRKQLDALTAALASSQSQTEELPAPASRGRRQ